MARAPTGQFSAVLAGSQKFVVTCWLAVTCSSTTLPFPTPPKLLLCCRPTDLYNSHKCSCLLPDMPPSHRQRGCSLHVMMKFPIQLLQLNSLPFHSLYGKNNPMSAFCRWLLRACTDGVKLTCVWRRARTWCVLAPSTFTPRKEKSWCQPS